MEEGIYKYLFCYILMKEQYYIDKLLFLIEKSVNKLDKKKGYALAFSGGLDSCVLAKIMLNKKVRFGAYVVGTKKSHDITYAKKVAKKLKIRLKVIKINENDIKIGIKLMKKILGRGANPENVSFNLPLYFVARYCKEKFIVCGQGADELFGGYNKYLRLNEKEGKVELKADLVNFIGFGVLQNKKTVQYFKKKLLLPYLNKEIIEFNENLPYQLKINKRIRKYILRKTAEKLKLGKKISNKEKKAAQYGTGIIWIMKKLAKKENVHISRYFKDISRHQK